MTMDDGLWAILKISHDPEERALHVFTVGAADEEGNLDTTFSYAGDLTFNDCLTLARGHARWANSILRDGPLEIVEEGLQS